MNTETLIAVLFVLVFSTLALLLWNWKTRDDAKRQDREEEPEDAAAATTECPLCGETLPRGTRVHSAVYPGREFDLMHIHGCPHCWPGHIAAAGNHAFHDRRCPYCHEILPENGYVLAQVYRKPYRRTHVHVYGCTVCKPGRG